MKTKEVQQKLADIDQNLRALGDLNALVQNFITQKQVIDTLIAEVQAQKENIDAIPKKKEELENLIGEIATLKETTKEQQTLTEETKKVVDELKTKSDEIQSLSLQQLGTISNEKLSNSFDKVRDGLKLSNKSWFWWLFGTSMALLLSVAGIVIWQTSNGGNIFEINFLVKLAATSPIIFFEIFISGQYSRGEKLIEEYEFKASIARSLEAYKEIVENLFSDKDDDEYKKKLDFILDAIGKLYSSPMTNIRQNETKEIVGNKSTIPVLSDIKEMMSDVKDMVSRIHTS
ncbi:MAG: hypothetical protein WC099_01350 [Candidatus Paceibacterota bacterium]